MARTHGIGRDAMGGWSVLGLAVSFYCFSMPLLALQPIHPQELQPTDCESVEDASIFAEHERYTGASRP
jgi:hypothetical protein